MDAEAIRLRLLAQIYGGGGITGQSLILPTATCLSATNVSNIIPVQSQTTMPVTTTVTNGSASKPPTTLPSAINESTSMELTIRVVTPKNKRNAKTYVLHSVPLVTSLKGLKEVILEQLGKKVVCFDLEFDVGYSVGSKRISFSESDDIKVQLKKVVQKNYSLWCEGMDSLPKRKLAVDSAETVVLDSDDSDDEVVSKNKKVKLSAYDEKKQAVEGIASDLKKKHGDQYNMVQYKFWAETLYNKRHSSWDDPPQGLIWGGRGKFKQKAEKVDTATDSMMKSVADMATTIATAIKSPAANMQNLSNTSPPRPQGNNTSSAAVGISPGRKIDLQDKILRQIELLHKMLECGAITPSQFEVRRESAMKQLDQLDQ